MKNNPGRLPLPPAVGDHNDLPIHEEAAIPTDDHRVTAHAGPQTGRLGRRMHFAMTSRTQGWWWAAVAVAAPVLVLAALPAAARPVATSVRAIHLVAHEKQRKFLDNGGFGDQEIFHGILDNATGTTQV